MQNNVEQLESRRLFSAGLSATVTADLAKLAQDAASIRAQYLQYTPKMRQNLQALRSSVQAAHLPLAGPLLARVASASVVDFAVGRADVFSLLAIESAGVRKMAADATRLAAHPNSAILQARVTADVTALNARMSFATTLLGTHGANLGAVASAALTAVGTLFSSNTSVTNAITTLENDGSTFITGVAATVQSLQADVAKYFSDVSAGK